MLNELIDIFCGMYIYALDLLGMSDYEGKEYFVSMMCLLLSVVMTSGTFIVISVIISNIFKTIRGVTK